MPPALVARLSIYGCVLGSLLACGDRQSADRKSVSDAHRRQSSLWGAKGELWATTSRLPDFSQAGYGAGIAPPEVPVAVNVRDFGAAGDGVTDDSRPFAAALAAARDGAVLIPAGRYRLRRVLQLDRSGLVLRGAGSDETVLFFDLPLYEVLGKGPFGGPFGWAWGGGFIWARGEFKEGAALAKISAEARRGDRSLRLSSTRKLAPGQLVRLAQSEGDGSLTLHLHNNQPLNGRCWVDIPGFRSIDWVFRIDRVEGNEVHLDRPLRVDVRMSWQPEILPFHPTVEEIGVEDLKIEFPPTEYNGHHNEPGYNAVYFNDVHNAWVRNVVIENFDTAISFWHVRYSSAAGIRLTGRGGHYGINLGASQDSWVTDFVLENVSQHDLSVSNLANGNVFSNGKGVDINFDHHRGAAYENLFSNIHVGESWRRNRLWDSSGTPTGHNTAAREIFWNIRPRVSTKWIPAWPQMSIIGPIRHKDPKKDTLEDLFVEPVRRLLPADLHKAQRKRLGQGGGSQG